MRNSSAEAVTPSARRRSLEASPGSPGRRRGAALDHDATAGRAARGRSHRIGRAGRSSWSPTWPCTTPTSSRATVCARGCSAPPTPTPRRRRCSTPRTRPGEPWVSTRTASSCFPAATRNGLYQVSPQVTVDVHRAIAAGRGGAKRTEEPTLAIAYLPRRARPGRGRAAGQRAVGVLMVGGGGSRRPHRRRARRRRLLPWPRWPSADGHFDLAALGTGTGTASSSRTARRSLGAAMQVAAAEGDADRLRLEWRECQRRLDALDPGSSPSPRTESLYGELSRRVRLAGPRPDVPGHATHRRPATELRPPRSYAPHDLLEAGHPAALDEERVRRDRPSAVAPRRRRCRAPGPSRRERSR